MIKNNHIISYMHQGSLEAYIKSANSYPILTLKEEKKLTKSLYYNSNLESAKKLILSHLRFVIHISRNYSGYGLPQADLIQEGNIGLMKAIRRFNPKIGVRLVSFAVHWIKAEIHEYVLRNWRIVKIATTKSQRKLFFNLRKVKKHLNWLNKNEIEVVAKELGVSNKDVQEMESRMSSKDMTLNQKPEEKKNEKQLIIPIFYLKNKTSSFTDDIEDKNWYNHNTNKLNIALKNLDNRSKDIIKARWLNENNKNTLQELANRYGVSAERVRQLEKNAMKKIRIFIEK